MNWFFVAILIFMIVAVAFVVGVAAYHAGMWKERRAWNKHLGLPERTKQYFTSEDIGKCVARKIEPEIGKHEFS